MMIDDVFLSFIGDSFCVFCFNFSADEDASEQ